MSANRSELSVPFAKAINPRMHLVNVLISANDALVISSNRAKYISGYTSPGIISIIVRVHAGGRTPLLNVCIFLEFSRRPSVSVCVFDNYKKWIKMGGVLVAHRHTSTHHIVDGAIHLYCYMVHLHSISFLLFTPFAPVTWLSIFQLSRRHF